MLLSLAFIPFLFTAAQNVAVSPVDEMRSAYSALKAAEEQKDTDAIVKQAAVAAKSAQAILKTPQPKDAAKVEDWKTSQELAKEVGPYADYAVYAAALREPDRVVELYEALDKQDPGNKYSSQLVGQYLAAVSATPAGANKAFDIANKVVVKDPNNEDLLALLAEGCMARKQFDRAATFASKLATVMGAKAKPEGMAAADWERRKTLLTGHGHYMAGLSYAAVNKFGLADKSLRAAVPYVKGDASLYGPVLFYLGLANYNMARVTSDKPRMKEALAFSEEAFKVGGAYAQNANQNVYAIKQELAKMR